MAMVFCGVDMSILACAGPARTVDLSKEVLEQRVVNFSALGMILDTKCEGIIAESDLLDDVVGCAPRFDDEALAQ